MPTITVPEETYRRLVQHAAMVGSTPDAVVLPAIERAAAIFERSQTSPPAEPAPLTGDAWLQKFHEFNHTVQAEASRYPNGFRLDDSREAMYAGCGE